MNRNFLLIEQYKRKIIEGEGWFLQRGMWGKRQNENAHKIFYFALQLWSLYIGPKGSVTLNWNYWNNNPIIFHIHEHWKDKIIEASWPRGWSWIAVSRYFRMVMIDKLVEIWHLLIVTRCRSLIFFGMTSLWLFSIGNFGGIDA